MEYKEVTFEELLNNVKEYIKRPENLELIQKAYDFAKEHHEGQFRKSGQPYVTHVIQVANELALLHCGPKTIAAGLLHDTVEDCEGVTDDTIKEQFGEEIATMVEAVTKIGALEFQDEKEYMASNHRKLFIAMAKDIRVILIKLSDRLHNMRTLQYMRPEKQKKIASETLSVYAPIAHRLGISEIKNELEDLCFKYLDYDKYEEIKRLVKQRESDRNAQVEMMIEDIKTVLDHFNIPYRIFGRSKHFYSIYKKMVTKNKRFEEILDLLAIRIITDNVMHCYEILGYIHATYRPIPGRFKDYIAMPKANMYQSLHTTVVEPQEGNIFEIQIRTEEMDAIAERGVAAHWKYKEKPNTVEFHQKEIEDKLSWFRDFSMMTDDETDDPLEYMNVLQKDIFEANVYCLTPRGKVISLASGATPIDFAYRIHTEVGHKTVGAKVNGAIVPLNTPLKTGDVVDIMTNNNSPGPSPDWIKIVKTAHARNKIRSYLQKQEQPQDRKELIKEGKTRLKDEFKKQKLDSDILTEKRLEAILPSLSFKTVDDLMVGIATEKVSVISVIDRLVKNRNSMMDPETLMENINESAPKIRTDSSGVIVPGIDTMAIELANCCKPIPGDPIVGYIKTGHGVRVHRADCPNVAKEKRKIIPVYWSDHLEDKKYEVNLQIHSYDRNFLLSDIVTVLQQSNTSLRQVNSRIDDNQLTATTTVSIMVKNAEHLQNIMANLRKVRSVTEVIRTIK